MSLFHRSPRHLADKLTMRQQVFIFTWEIFKVVVISLAIILPVRYFLIKPFYVKGASMEPNFYDHEYLIIDEISYRFFEPQRGDIVVFRYPQDPRQYFIKRIVGLPNEQVKLIGGTVYITNATNPDGAPLAEPYLPEGLSTSGSVEVTLGADQYYVLGDNRTSSLDSRAFGPLSRSEVVGRVLWRGWPVERIGLIGQAPEDNIP